MQSISVLYDVSIYDHFPICFDVHVSSNVHVLSNSKKHFIIENFVDWRKFGTEQRKDYETNITEMFSNLNICDDEHCTNDHSAHIDDVNNRFVEAFHCATIEYRICEMTNFKPVPGWNDFCKEKYKTARQAFLSRLSSGKVRSTNLYENMKSTKKIFVNALKFCKYNENMIRSNK